MIDVSTLTLGELATVERLGGQSLAKLGSGEAPMGLTLAALAYVHRKRTDATFTFDDAQALTIDQANDILGVNEPVVADPTQPTTA